MINNIKPNKNNGRLCGVCCIGGVTGMSNEDVLANYLQDREHGTSYECILNAAIRLQAEAKVLAVDSSLPKIYAHYCFDGLEFGRPAWSNSTFWYEKAEMMLNDGYVGIAKVNGRGDAWGTGEHQMVADHWVLINGYTVDENCNRFILFSCPDRGDNRTTPFHFLKHYGGYNTIWIKPLTVE